MNRPWRSQIEPLARSWRFVIFRPFPWLVCQCEAATGSARRRSAAPSSCAQTAALLPTRPLRLPPRHSIPDFPSPRNSNRPPRPAARAPPMPSKRSSSHAMDEAAAAAARLDAASARSKSRARDRRHRSPNPNPSFRHRAPPGLGPTSTARKSDRKPKLRSFPDSTTLAAAAAAASAPASSSRGAAQKLWSDADEVALLTGAAAFKARAGVAPRLPDMSDFYEFLSDSISPHLDQAKVYYKLKRLKSKFQHSAPGASSTLHDRLVRDISADLWGAELAHQVEDGERTVEDDADFEEADGVNAIQVRADGDSDKEEPERLPIVREVLGEYWRLNGQVLSGVSLEKGLSLVAPDEADVAEAKWRRQLEEDMRMQMRWHDLGKEVYGLLMDAIKGLGP
jgi:hypothetical protein